MAQYQRGTGPQQLPQGAAGQLNAAQPPPAQEIQVQYHDPRTAAPEPADSSLPDNNRILVAPPDPTYNVPPAPPQTGVPDYVIRHLPDLMSAAHDPTAPPQIVALYRAVVDQATREQTAS